MAKSNERTIKVRLFTWFENVESPAVPGEMVRAERISHMGDVVEINDEESLKRGEELDAFYSKEDAKAIAEGTYAGTDAAILEVVSGKTQRPAAPAEATAIEGEGPQTESLSVEELGAYIHAHKLNVSDTVALAQEGNVDSIQKVWDAEDHAAQLRGNDSRTGVTEKLDAMLHAATDGGSAN